MSFEYLNKIAENFELLNISVLDAITRFIVAGVLGTISSFIYRMYSKENYIHDLQQSLVFLSLIICSSMMIIGNNLASAFGLVGAVSIIRFRTVVKSSRDMAFVLFNITIGMACGLGYLVLGITSFVLISLAMLMIYFFSHKINYQKMDIYNLEIKYSGMLVDESIFESILSKYKCSYNLNSLSSNPGKVRYSYYFRVDDKKVVPKLINDLTLIESLNDMKIKCTVLEKNNE